MQNQYLLFTLCNEKYAVEVTNVQEVLSYTEVSKIPCALSYVEGLINSRGRGISVINLRKKFNIADAPVTKDTRIIVVELPRNETDVTVLGAVTDSVQEVIEINTEEIENAPKFGCKIPSKFIKGIVSYNEEFVTLLDAQLVFGKEDAAFADNMATLEVLDEGDEVPLS